MSGNSSIFFRISSNLPKCHGFSPAAKLFMKKELSATLETIHKTCRININHLPKVCACSMTYDLYNKREIKTGLMED